MSYQKFYTNPIQSSSLLCQLASMLKNDIMCDAVIKTGNVNTKAHRVVMMAACPMLQSMDHAASGSKLEIRLSPDIKQQSINSFLQYLYEGFMMVTEDNYKDIEKIGRLLQVDSVIKCCADFCKSLTVGRGSLSNADQYRYTFCDMIEFRHVRSSDLQRTISENQVKRSHDMHGHDLDNGVKRSRTRHSSSPMKSSNRNLSTGNQTDNVLDERILQDSLELVQVDPADSGGSRQSVGVGVVSHCENNPETSVVIPAEECCDTPCGSTVVSESETSTCTNTVSRNQTPPSSDASGQRQSPHQSSESMEEISKELKNRPPETTPDLAKSCDPKESTEAQGNRFQYNSQLGPDLSIVKVESITPDPDRHRILEQEQVAADYQDNSSQHRSRSSESMELGQQGSALRSNDGSTHKILDSMTELNEHIRYHTGNLIRMLPDNQQSNQQNSHPGESMSSLDHRGHPHKMNQQGKQQSRVHTVSSPPYPFSVSSTMHHLPPVSALSHFMLPPPTHHQVAVKPPPTGLIDLSEDSSGETHRSGDSQPPAMHKLMYIPNRKPCTWCQIKGVKTKSGWYCYASYKCEVCDVPLCKQGRVCFQEYHRHIGIPDSEIVNPNNDSGSFLFDFSPNK